MANINQQDMELMRQQAIERVNQMQKQSQKYINQINVQANNNSRSNNFGSTLNKEPLPIIHSPKPLTQDNHKNPVENHYKSFTTNDVKRYFRKIPTKSYHFNNQSHQNTNKSNNHVQSSSPPPLQNIMGNPASVLGGLTERFFPSLKGKIDSEVLIIVALIIILAKDGADIKLLIALGYLLI